MQHSINDQCKKNYRNFTAVQLFLHKLSCTSSTLKIFIPYLLDLGTYWYVNFQKQANGLQGVLVITRVCFFQNPQLACFYSYPKSGRWISGAKVFEIVRLFNCKMLQFRRNSWKSHIHCILL